MSKNQEYALQYADYAMAQMRRYGIPASVTLAQGILESMGSVGGLYGFKRRLGTCLGIGYLCLACHYERR